MKNDVLSIGKIRSLAQEFFIGSRGSHDWDHTLRVYKLCERIGVAEDNDMTVLLSAAYLHDIGRYHQDRQNGAVCHAQKGAQMAQGECLSRRDAGTFVLKSGQPRPDRPLLTTSPRAPFRRDRVVGRVAED